MHWLIVNRGLEFVLCGASAGKLRHGHANLLGGRAVRHELFGLVSVEVGDDFDLLRFVNHGYLPRHHLAAAIEVKATEHAGGWHFVGLEAIRDDHQRVDRRMLVCLERRSRVRDDGIEVVAVRTFLQRLWADELF